MPATGQPPKIACPQCQGLIKAPALPPGSVVKCPKCGASFRLGEPAPPHGETPVTPPPSRTHKPADKPPPPSKPSHLSAPATEGQPAGSAERPASSARAPDQLVDPNLLPPPPPREKPKPTEVAIVCRLCGTRIYAPLERIGEEVKCPDCHSRNVVPPLPDADKGGTKPAGPTLDDTENFGMSDAVERPKYRPLVAPRGEYEVLSALDPAAMEHRLTVPGEQRPRSAAQARAKPKAQQAEPSDEHDDEEVVLAPPVERAQIVPDPRSLLPQPELEPENELYDGRYDDGVIGDNVDPRSPDAWKRAPLVYGILEFLFYASTLPRWLGLSALWAMVLVLGQLAWAGAMSDGLGQAGAVLLMLFFMPTCAIWIALASATFYAIVERTANGDLEIEEWPGWNFLEWIPTSAYFVAASVIAALPGGLLGLATLAASPDWKLAAFGIGAPPVLSWLVLFPLIMFSMLAEGSLTAVWSRYTTASLSEASSAWVFFYMYTIMLALAAVLAGSLFLLGNVVGDLSGAIGLTLAAFVYARLLGRVMWIAAGRVGESSSQ